MSSSVSTYSNQPEIKEFLFNGKELSNEFNNSEKSHMRDVKNLITLANFLLVSSFFIVFLYLIFFDEDIFFISSIISFLALATLAIFSFLDFNLIFNIFHELFFPMGNWTFPSTYKLIELFPLNYFILKSLQAFMVSLTLTTLFFLCSYNKRAS